MFPVYKKKILKMPKFGKNFRNIKLWEQRKVCALQVKVRCLHGRRIYLNLGSLLPSVPFWSLPFHVSPQWGPTPGFALAALPESPQLSEAPHTAFSLKSGLIKPRFCLWMFPGCSSSSRQQQTSKKLLVVYSLHLHPEEFGAPTQLRSGRGKQSKQGEAGLSASSFHAINYCRINICFPSMKV